MSEHNIDNLAGKDPSKSAIAKLIAWSVANQLIIIVLAIALAVGGWLSLKEMPLDDLSAFDKLIGPPKDKRCARVVHVWHQFCLCDL